MEEVLGVQVSRQNVKKIEPHFFSVWNYNSGDNVCFYIVQISE
jgi:hypothetical protein